MTSLGSVLGGHRRIGLDTPILIYHIEGHPTFSAAAGDVIGLLRRSAVTGVISVLAIMELQVRPLQLGRRGLAGRYEAIVRATPNLTVVDVDGRVARLAARLRATYDVRTIDALHLASCVEHGATAFVTNDTRLQRVTEIAPVILSDYLGV